MDDVEIVRGLLQQQAGGVAPLRVPVAEIEIAPVADEMTHPARLHFADRAAGNERLHLLHEGHVTHVVSDVESRVGLRRGAQDTVAAGNGERHRLFQVKREPAPDHRHRLVFVQEVRRGDDDGVEFARQQHPVVAGGEEAGAIVLAIARQGGRAHIAAGDNPRAAPGLVREQPEQRAASARANDANLQVGVFAFHDSGREPGKAQRRNSGSSRAQVDGWCRPPAVS